MMAMQYQDVSCFLGYRKVIEGFNKEFIMSLGLLDEVGKSESLPVIPVYRVLIYNFIKAGRLEMALQLHHEIASFSQVPAAYCSTYNALIESLSLARKDGGVPELSTFIHLIKGLITVNKWEEALQLSDSFCQMDIQWLREKETPDAA
ncbi:pentatricopeptide repeat-containing protein mitochondrial-like [Gossypium australe]|uniref:Pentatricopeptide repeat-containing protein mitochondrial-like n=1 Tax=Gossypium australe TaxID=47621 RepID=A0A5B6WWY7_9ROSI|nr:pentatricopeptide repeat-containing protein mitochondrial-like [Gossypium australe]